MLGVQQWAETRRPVLVGGRSRRRPARPRPAGHGEVLEHPPAAHVARRRGPGCSRWRPVGDVEGRLGASATTGSWAKSDIVRMLPARTLERIQVQS